MGPRSARSSAVIRPVSNNPTGKQSSTSARCSAKQWRRVAAKAHAGRGQSCSVMDPRYPGAPALGAGQTLVRLRPRLPGLTGTNVPHRESVSNRHSSVGFLDSGEPGAVTVNKGQHGSQDLRVFGLATASKFDSLIPFRTRRSLRFVMLTRNTSPQVVHCWNYNPARQSRNQQIPTHSQPCSGFPASRACPRADFQAVGHAPSPHRMRYFVS